MEFYIAQGISILASIVAILLMQINNMKKILIAQITLNLLVASTYFLLNKFSGVGISLIAIIQLIVMFGYNKKEKKPHNFVVGLFILAYACYSLFTFKSFIDLFPLIAAILFALGAAQVNPATFRTFGMLNPLFWLVYDIYTLAIVNAIMRVGIFTSAVISKVRLDGFLKNKQ